MIFVKLEVNHPYNHHGSQFVGSEYHRRKQLNLGLYPPKGRFTVHIFIR